MSTNPNAQNNPNDDNSNEIKQYFLSPQGILKVLEIILCVITCCLYGIKTRDIKHTPLHSEVYFEGVYTSHSTSFDYDYVYQLSIAVSIIVILAIAAACSLNHVLAQLCFHTTKCTCVLATGIVTAVLTVVLCAVSLHAFRSHDLKPHEEPITTAAVLGFVTAFVFLVDACHFCMIKSAAANGPATATA